MLIPSETRAQWRDIVEVTEEGHRRHGERFAVLNSHAGIGSAYILACSQTNRADRIGLRHDQVTIVGRLDPTRPLIA